MLIVNQCGNSFVETKNICSLYVKTYDEKTYFIKAAYGGETHVIATFDSQKAAQDVFNQIVAAIAKNAKVFFISKAR